MSILPSQNLGSTSSSPSPAPFTNPNPNHGTPLHHQHSPPSLSSLSISQSSTPDNPSEAMPHAEEDTGGSSEKVNAAGALDSKRNLSHQKTGSRFQRNHSGQSGVGSAQRRWSPSNQKKSGATVGQGSSPQPVGRKTQMVNGNHLLNFHYDPISRPQPRPPAKRQQKRKPYNKDLFLQANYKFVMLDSGNYTPESIDPDKSLRWEDIICVKYFTPVPAHCPICLEDLLCPQMTSCGHIFCFPCILRYFLMGEDNHKRECWKKCPLCFMMISSKDLYTLYVESVKEHCVGDTIEFMLLTRQKDSLTLALKSKQDDQEVHDSFSKFTFTTDVDLSVRKAISELDSWLAKADSGLVDDLERLPYVCAAMEQLEERKKYWNDHRFYAGNNYGKDEDLHSKSPPTGSTGSGNDWTDPWGSISTSVNEKSMWLGSSTPDESNGEPFLDRTVDVIESNAGQDKALSSSSDDAKNIETQANGSMDGKIKDSYDFYQAVDGQYLILHPLNMKCLLHHFGSYDKLPQRLSGKIIQLETVTQSEAMRRRYRYLSHFSLTTTFQLCEIDLSGILPSTALSPFMDEIKNREKQRKRLARKEQEEKIKAEAAAATHYMSLPFDALQPSHDYAPVFSLDDFEALGSSAVTSSSSPPNVGERPLFSNVTRLGYAAVAPALRTDKAPAPDASPASSGLHNGGGASSFANVISRTKPPVEPKISEVGKKGKKASRTLLLSTAGGRRY